MMNHTLLNEMQTSQMIGIKPATLRKWRWEGKEPQFLKVGRRVYYRRDDLTAFLESSIRKSTSDTGEV